MILPSRALDTLGTPRLYSEDEDDWGHFSFEDGDAPPSSLENYRWN